MLLSRVELELGETGVWCASLAVSYQGAVVVHFAVDEVVVGEWRGAWRCLHDLFDNLEIFGVIVVAEQYWSEVIVVWRLRRAMDDHGSNQASCILSAVVRVIPRSAVEISNERVGKAFPGGNRALLHGWDAIEPWRSLLQYPVPMQGGAFFGPGDVIAHVNRNSVSPVGLNGRSRESSIDEKSTFIDTIRGNSPSSNVEIVSRSTSCKNFQLLSDLLIWNSAHQ